MSGGFCYETASPHNPRRSRAHIVRAQTRAPQTGFKPGLNPPFNSPILRGPDMRTSRITLAALAVATIALSAPAEARGHPHHYRHHIRMARIPSEATAG